METLTGIVSDQEPLAKDWIEHRSYQVQLKRLLEIEIAPVVFVLNVNPKEREAFLAQLRGFVLDGFVEGDREFPETMVYPIVLSDQTKAGIWMTPQSVDDEERVEIVAPFSIPKRFRLNANDSFTIGSGEYAFPNKQ